MQEFAFRIYSILEIKKQKIIFTVFKISSERTMNIYQKEIVIDSSWIDNFDCLKNPNLVALKVNELISNFHKIYPHFTLTKIALVIPSKFLKINLVSRELDCGDRNKILIDRELVAKLQNEAWKPSMVDAEVVDVQLTNWYVNGVPTHLEDIVIEKVQKITYEALTYEVPRSIVKSYYQFLEILGLSCLKIMTNLQACYSFLSDVKVENYETLVANWENDRLDLGYFENGYLKMNVTIDEGLNFVINSLAEKMEISPKVIENYLFNLIVFDKNSHQQIVCQKWDNKQKVLRKYSLKTLKEMISQELNQLYLKVYKIIKTKVAKDIVNHYHFGVIQQITNLEVLLPHFNDWMQNAPALTNYQTFGFKNNLNILLGFGLAKHLDLVNRYNLNSTTLTSLGESSKVVRNQHQHFPISESLNADYFNNLMFLKF